MTRRRGGWITPLINGRRRAESRRRGGGAETDPTHRGHLVGRGSRGGRSEDGGHKNTEAGYWAGADLQTDRGAANGYPSPGYFSNIKLT
jgi:hypothetical protein